MADEQGGRVIRSVEELRRRIPAIVRQVNADERLALRAAANPLLLLEELGYEIPPELRAELERRVRHTPQDIARLDTLERQVHELAGERFDLRAPAELSRVLFEKLKLPRPPAVQQLALRRGALAAQTAEQRAEPQEPTELPRHPVGRPKHPDPLEPLRGAHPVMEPLLEYRALEASQPPLASQEVYERIKRGEVRGPALRVRFRLQRGPTPE